MFQISFVSIIPIVLLLLLGYFSSIKKQFDNNSVESFNRLIMQYLLPFSLFSSIAKISMSTLVSHFDFFIIIFLAMSVFMFLDLIINKFLFSCSIDKSVLRSLVFCSAAIPFIGTPVLSPLLGHEYVVIIIVASAFALAVVQQPLAFILLASNHEENTPKITFKRNLYLTLKEPVVFMPIIALVLLFFNIPIPDFILNVGHLIGNAIPALAMFTAGIVLHSQKITFNLPIAISVIIKNLITPLALFLILNCLSFDPFIVKYSVIAISIPVGSIIVLTAIKFNTLKQEMDSTFF